MFQKCRKQAGTKTVREAENANADTVIGTENTSVGASRKNSGCSDGGRGRLEKFSARYWGGAHEASG
jgi:hypothetical protein